MSSPIPRIAVTPQWNGDLNEIRMYPGYMDVFSRCGALPLMPDMTFHTALLDEFLGICDGLFISGGHDVSPEYYGETVHPQCGPLAPQRDQLELYLYRRAMERNMPVFGICRGLQLMTVAAGGTLYQDLPTEFSDRIDHRMTAPFDRHVHDIIVTPGSALEQLTGRTVFKVNSIHHQGIKTPGAGYRVAATAPDGLIEAVDMPDRLYVRGVQWHPERTMDYDLESKAVIEEFVAACRNFMNSKI